MLDRENMSIAIVANILPDSALCEAVPAGLRLTIGSQTWVLSTKYIGEGVRADVRRWLARESREAAGDILVLTAREMTSGARAEMEERGISWADGTGAATISDGRGLYISRGKPRRILERLMTWSPAVGATAEVALEWRRRGGPGDGSWVGRPSSIAEVTGYSYAQTSKALAIFDEQGYTEKVGAERGPSAMREFRDPARLLSDWSGFYRRASSSLSGAQFHVPWRSVGESLRLVHNALQVPWVVSGTAAADRLAPHLTQQTDLLIYVSADAMARARTSLLASSGVSEVSSGGRLRLEVAPEYVLQLSVDSGDERLAPPIRVYGDLLRLRGRGEDAADFLREVAIGF